MNYVKGKQKGFYFQKLLNMQHSLYNLICYERKLYFYPNVISVFDFIENKSGYHGFKITEQ